MYTSESPSSAVGPASESKESTNSLRSDSEVLGRLLPLDLSLRCIDLFNTPLSGEVGADLAVGGCTAELDTDRMGLKRF
jgi:hypothetical protein